MSFNSNAIYYNLTIQAAAQAAVQAASQTTAQSAHHTPEMKSEEERANVSYEEHLEQVYYRTKEPNEESDLISKKFLIFLSFLFLLKFIQDFYSKIILNKNRILLYYIFFHKKKSSLTKF